MTEVIGVSGESWETAAQSAVQTAASTVRDLRVAEVVRQDVVIENRQVSGFLVRLTRSSASRATSSEAPAAAVKSGRRGSATAGRHHGQLARTARI